MWSSFVETDYLFVTDDDGGDGCLSHVGRLGGYQPLILGRGCESFAHTAHEVGHALGLYHTQSRHDRDDYIKVNWDNIPQSANKNHQRSVRVEDSHILLTAINVFVQVATVDRFVMNW
ncbi:astacin [Ancylostoma duodenale]|uniref:Metalloendopeptidase n=1 Tax=Ancylostoma duodenale TaxID=51022 RepID=A0A0C2FTR2_9BILA|nr:astacin [Ancylostoma duodenale]